MKSNFTDTLGIARRYRRVWNQVRTTVSSALFGSATGLAIRPAVANSAHAFENRTHAETLISDSSLVSLNARWLMAVVFVAGGFLPVVTHAADPDRGQQLTKRSGDAELDSVKELEGKLMPFLRENCLDCHDGQEGEGGFDLNALELTALRDHTAIKPLNRWVRVFDRINDSEMPPEEFGEADGETKQRFLGELQTSIESIEEKRTAAIGRVQSRRLTNDQLQWTLCDLLSIDVPLAELMPEEPRTDGFRNLADSQSMSYYHLEDHLRVVDAALDYAFDRLQNRNDGSVMELAANRIANKRKGQRNREPEMRQGAAVVWASAMAFYGRISNSRVRESGWYSITLDASSIKMPKGKGLWCSVRSGECVSNAPLMNWIGGFEATADSKTHRYLAWIEGGHKLEIRPADSTLKNAKFNGGQVGFGEGEPQNVAGLAMHDLKIERIYPGGTREDVRSRLLGDLNARFNRAKERWELKSKTPRRELKRQVRQFAEAAFRRPLDADAMALYLELIDQGIAEKQAPMQVLREVYRAILCSPRFIYFTEAPGKLDQHAVANRLSYLLTGTAPDAQLRLAADRGELGNSQAIVAHTRRLLQGENLKHFVSDFADQWLDLADIDFTEPDRRMHRDFDLVVQNAMLEETRRYLQTMVGENRPAAQLVDSDFTWLNNRLADYYGIDEDIDPSAWKQVSLEQHPYRGGLMTHGSILKVTANGTNTSPVVRGVWICDRLLGVPIPDPPENVPAIEPDVRGAKTVRQILEKHRSQVECAACHRRIDPPGFALEHFDAAGQWRDHYLVRKNRSYGRGPEVDSAYVLRDGRPFDSFAGFRQLAASDPVPVAQNFAAKLLVYATGQPISFADRKAIEAIADSTRKDDYGLRSLIEAVVTSQPFLNK